MFTVILFMTVTTSTALNDRQTWLTCVEQIQTSSSKPEISKLVHWFCCPSPFPSFHIPPPPPALNMTSDILYSSIHSYIRYHSYTQRDGWWIHILQLLLRTPIQMFTASHFCILHTFSFLRSKERSPLNQSVIMLPHTLFESSSHSVHRKVDSNNHIPLLPTSTLGNICHTGQRGIQQQTETKKPQPP